MKFSFYDNCPAIALSVMADPFDYVRQYMRLYPADKVTIIGGAAAYLHLQQGDLKDIDLNINTAAQAEIIVQRWRSLMPASYIIQSDINGANGIINLHDPAAQKISFDIFVNEFVNLPIVTIQGLAVRTTASMIEELEQDLIGRQRDLIYLQNHDTYGELSHARAKYQRLVTRLQLLKQYS